MKRELVHRCWAPADGRFSDWVKPVLFANMDEDVEPRAMLIEQPWLSSELIEPLGRVNDTAIVIDLPGEVGACVGVALIDHGFCPVPLYNAVQWEASIVNLQPVVDVLVSAAERMMAVDASAPPAFMLDAHRMSGAHRLKPGVFDNRSVCHLTDFPSVHVLRSAGIRRAVLIQEEDARPAPDLELVLADWQQAGIALWRKNTDDHAPAAPFVLRQRLLPVRIFHYLQRGLLRRRADDSYGMFVEVPNAG